MTSTGLGLHCSLRSWPGCTRTSCSPASRLGSSQQPSYPLRMFCVFFCSGSCVLCVLCVCHVRVLQQRVWLDHVSVFCVRCVCVCVQGRGIWCHQTSRRGPRVCLCVCSRMSAFMCLLWCVYLCVCFGLWCLRSSCSFGEPRTS